MTVQAVGILSPGDMGHAVGRVLVDNGMKVITCLEGRSKRTGELSKQAGIKAVPTYGQLVHDAGPKKVELKKNQEVIIRR